MLFGNLPKRGELAAARIGEQNVDRACFVLHHRKEPVEIGEVRDIALDAAGIVPDLGDGHFQLFLAPAGHEHPRALRGEALRRSQADAAVAR